MFKKRFIINHKQASAHGNIRVSCSCVYVTHEQKGFLKKKWAGMNEKVTGEA